jgi:hypothetical protein
MNLQDLPPEILTRIIAHCDRDTIINARAVSQALKSTFTDHVTSLSLLSGYHSANEHYWHRFPGIHTVKMPHDSIFTAVWRLRPLTIKALEANGEIIPRLSAFQSLSSLTINREVTQDRMLLLLDEARSMPALRSLEFRVPFSMSQVQLHLHMLSP